MAKREYNLPKLAMTLTVDDNFVNLKSAGPSLMMDQSSSDTAESSKVVQTPKASFIMLPACNRNQKQSINSFHEVYRRHNENSHELQTEELGNIAESQSTAGVWVHEFRGKTEFEILQGFSMQHFLVFFTIDVASQDKDIYFEVFERTKAPGVHEEELVRKRKIKLFAAKMMDSWSFAVDRDKQFICCYLFRWNFQESDDPLFNVHFLNVDLYIHKLEKHEDEDGFYFQLDTQGLETACQKTQIFDVESVIQKTTSNDNHVEITVVVTCTNDQKTFKKVYARTRFEQFMRLTTLAKLAQDAQSQHAHTAEPRKEESLQKKLGRQLSQLPQLTQLARKLTQNSLKVFEQVTDEQDVVGIYTLLNQPLIILSNGELHIVKKSQDKKYYFEKHRLPIGAREIKVAQLTNGSNGLVPRLYVQSKDSMICCFEKRDEKWEEVTSFFQPNHRLVKAHGKIVIVEHTVSYELKLLELELNSLEPIITELKLSTSHQPYRVDSSDLDNTSLLKFSIAGHDFQFTRQPSGRLLRHSDKDFLDQVCGDLLISLRKDLKLAYIEANFIKSLGNPFKAAKSYDMPPLEADLDSFAAYEDKQNTKNPKVLLLVKPEAINRVQQTDPQFLLVIKPTNFNILRVRFDELPIKGIVRDERGRIFVQTEHKIGEYKLKRDNRLKDYSYVLKPKFNGISLSLGSSSLTLFDVACIREEYHMLLYQSKLGSNKSKKFIYSINLTQQVMSGEGIDIETIAKQPFELLTDVKDQSFFPAESKQQIRACYDSSSKNVFAIVASPQFAVLYKHEFTGDADVPQQVNLCAFLTIKNADKLAVINNEQVAIYSNLDMIVVNHVNQPDLKKQLEKEGLKKLIVKSLDFKFSLTSQIKQIAFSHNIMTLIYGQSSFLVHIGKAKLSSDIINRELFLTDLKRSLSKWYWTQEDEDDNLMETSQVCLHTFNEVSNYFKRNLLAFKRSGYICLKEETGNWDQETKFTPIDIHSADILTLDPEGDEEQSFDEIVIAQLAFLNGQSIWEVLIRNAIIKRQVQVTNAQLPRFFRPYFGDNCRSLVHHFSNSKLDLLVEIFQLPGVKMYFKGFTHPSPIFFDVHGQTPLHLAINNRDFRSFYVLVDFMLGYQDNVRNSYLVRPLLLKILKLGLDVTNLFNSSLCSYQLNDDEMEHFDSFPVFHEDRSSAIVNYQQPIEHLLHDEEAYETLFSKMFPISKAETQLQFRSKDTASPIKKLKRSMSGSAQDRQRQAHKRKSVKERPVEYHANIYPIAFGHEDDKDLKKNATKVSELLETLAKSERLSIFGTKYIQDFIDYQWDGRLKTAYFVIFIVYFVSFVLSLVSSSLMNYDENDDYPKYDKARVVICAFNALLAVVAIGAFEIRQIIVEKAAYFKSFWNYNDIAVLVTSILVLIMEISVLRSDSVQAKEAFNQQDDSRMLKPRSRNRGGSGSTITTEEGDVELYFEIRLLQWLRVAYASLIFTGFFKVLNVASAFQSVGYLVAMLSGVFYNAMPFLIFFVYLNLTFTFIFYVMYIQFDPTMTKDGMGEYQGIEDFQLLPYILYTFRQSLGDFKTDTFLFLPPVDRYATWFLWLSCILINAMVFLNFLIVTIESVYEECSITRIERAYKSKAGLLRALDLVLGDYIDCKPANILVIRQSLDGLDRQQPDAVAELTKEVHQLKIEVDCIIQDTKDVKHEVSAIVRETQEMKHEVVSLAQDTKEIKKEINDIKEYLITALAKAGVKA